MQADFEISHYNIDVYYNGKYYGCTNVDTPDRDILGYNGRKKVILSEDWQYKNKRIKAGTEVITECVPVCGKLKGSFKEKIQLLSQSKAIYNLK